MSLQPSSSCTDLAWFSPVDAPQYRRADPWFPRGPVSMPAAIHLDVQIGPDSAGRGVWGGPSPRSCRVPAVFPAPPCFQAQGVHAPRGSLGPSSGLSPPTHTTVPGGGCVHTVRISRPVRGVPGESRSYLTEDIVRVLCSKALR